MLYQKNNFKLYYSFYQVATEMNVSKAAKKNNVSESVLIHDIKSLEEFLHLNLINRTEKEITLTSEGKLLYVKLNTIFERKDKEEQNNIENRYNCSIKIKKLEKFSSSENINEEKKLIKYYKTRNINYRFSETINYLKNKKRYEIFISVSDGKDIADALMYKTISNKPLAFIYYYVLKKIIDSHNINLIAKLVKKK